MDTMLSSKHTAKQQLCSPRAAIIPFTPSNHSLRSPILQKHRLAAHVGPPAALAATAASSSSSSSRRAVVAAASASKKQQGSTAAGKGFGSPSKLANKSAANEKRKCPCGSGQLYPSCCGRYHAGAVAPTPEALLRSRFSAYAMQIVDYLVATTHTQNAEYTGDAKSYARTVKRTAQGTEYLGLKVLDLPEEYQARMQQAAAASDGSSSSSSGNGGEDAYVKFSVRWRPRGAGGAENLVTEVSHFKRVDGRWLYYAECE